jgi:hypothetical protein
MCFLSGNVPDNYKTFEYGWYKGIDFKRESDELLKVLDKAKKENDIQRYIKDNKKWFIPASILKDYDFGHHEAYLVPEMPLGNEYKTDYMILGRNSIGHHIILVEFEDVNVEYKIKTANRENLSVQKGLGQIKDWRRWMDKNKDYFLSKDGLRSIKNNIPAWGINYCLVVSRRKLMSNVANEMRGQTQADIKGLKIISYDRLVDNVKMLANGF